MGKEARRQARLTLAQEHPRVTRQPEGYGMPTKAHYEYANTPFSLGYGKGGHAPAHYSGPHPLASELDKFGTPHKHKPEAYRSRQWRKLFGKNGIHGLEQGLTFKEWRELGFPKVPVRETFTYTKKVDGIDVLAYGHRTGMPDDQVSAYMHSGAVDIEACKH